MHRPRRDKMAPFDLYGRSVPVKGDRANVPLLQRQRTLYMAKGYDGFVGRLLARLFGASGPGK